MLLLLSAPAGALPAAAVADDCDRPCVHVPCRAADGVACGLDDAARPLRVRSRVRPRQATTPCPPWQRCPLPPATAPGDVFQRFDDTARKRLSPLPAPPIRG